MTEQSKTQQPSPAIQRIEDLWRESDRRKREILSHPWRHPLAYLAIALFEGIPRTSDGFPGNKCPGG